MTKKYSPPTFSNSKKFNNGKDRRRSYDKEWQSYSYRFLHYNERCYCCGEKSTCVDHLRSFRQGKDKEWFWLQSNHIPMCSSCHSTVTARFDREWTEEKYLQKLKWINEKREQLGLRFSVKVVPRS